MAGSPAPAALAPYRVLELAGAVPLLCGRIFRDLGADVIKVEPPEGDPSRSLPPFVGDRPGPDRSLHWLAYAAGKRSVTLALETERGRDLFRRLVMVSDFVIEAFPAGYLAGLGLDYEALAQVNPRIIVVSLTPFGQSGPHAHHQATDLTLWARGGFLNMTGDPDRPPVRISLAPQIHYHASTIGAVGALIALRQRRQTGRGQHVDLAMQALPVWMLANTAAFWDIDRVNLSREGAWRDIGGGMRVRVVYRCKDGFITWAAMSGVIGARALDRLVAWMAAEGMAPDWLRATDWLTVNLRAMPREEFERYSEVFERFFMTKTKAELMEAAIRDGHMFGAVNTIADVMDSPQLAARDYWRKIGHPALGSDLLFPGPPAKMSETPWTIEACAPSRGQHNDEVYCGLAGIEPGDLTELRSSGTI
jgi:crotonobetainyl-CoA:carnitine CoA-transferase CaiB-like acyl-CoA transferase